MELDYPPPQPQPPLSTAMDAGMVPQQQQMQASNNNNNIFSAPPQQQHARILGLVIPGRAARTDFVPVDATGTKFALTLTTTATTATTGVGGVGVGGGDLPLPLTLVNEIVCYLESPSVLPNGHGLSIYWQLAAAASSNNNNNNNANNNNSNNEQISGFEWLGSLTADHPSEIFRTGWSEHDQFLALPPQQPATITIGISIEPLDTIRNLWNASNGGAAAGNAASNNRRPMVAQKIARDLYNFMQSFDTGGAMVGNGQMVVPQNIFERWWKRFEAKSKRDPNFFFKTAD